MDKVNKNVMVFLSGIVVGCTVTYQLIKKKYERLVQEEIDSVKEVFSRKYSSEIIESEDAIPNDTRTADLNTMQNIVQSGGYAVDCVRFDEGSTIRQREHTSPYLIPPEQFGEIEEYETISLIYYADHILADEDDEQVEDIDNVIGLDSLNHFGDYEEDSVFVRNDRLKCDYEILLDQSKYYDVLNNGPK